MMNSLHKANELALICSNLHVARGELVTEECNGTGPLVQNSTKACS
jgi:hypothetical protein